MGAPSMHPERTATGVAAAVRPLSVRAVAMALLVLGLAAAGLALFAMTLIDPVDARFLVFCGTTDAEVVDMRDASVLLLLSAATQALLVPKRELTVFACLMGLRTCLQADVVIYRVAHCHGAVQGVLALHYWLLLAMELAVFLVGFAITLFGHE